VSAPAPRTRRDTRAEVIAAAQRVIARKSLEATTLRDIAREGGFTTGVASHWFPDKQSLIVACFEAASEDWLAETRRAVDEHATVEEQLCAFVRAAIPARRERQEQWRLWSAMWTYAARDPDFARVLVETDRQWEDTIAEVLARAAGEGVLPPTVDGREQAAVLCRLIDGLGLRASISGNWDAAREQLMGYLRTIGLEVDLAPTEGEPA
jgi:AcrR family transcriptional regulator